MRVPLDAATHVTFGGERHVHGYVSHAFAGERAPPVALVARASQFSSYLLLLGRAGAGHTFEPTHATLLRNKDELTVPLGLEQLPTAQEFTDAIESLSPDQQRFAQVSS